MKELVKTEEGRLRIAKAVERLDVTMSELGQQHRTDVPQGRRSVLWMHISLLELPPVSCRFPQVSLSENRSRMSPGRCPLLLRRQA